MNIAFYISGHGFGHATRTAALAKEFCNMGFFCHVVSNRPAFVFAQLPQELSQQHKRTLDFGLVQKDMLQPDVDASLNQLEQLLANAPKLIDAEAAFIKKHQIGLVVADIPFVPFAAAAKAGVASVGVSNFDWLWMYKNMLPAGERTNAVCQQVQDMYAQASFGMRLPFSGTNSMQGFKTMYLAGLVCQQPTLTAKQVRADFAIPPDMALALVSFSNHDGQALNVKALAKVPNVVFVSRVPLAGVANSRVIDANYHYPSLVAAADVVITKAGYSTLAEVAAAGNFIVYTTRYDFAEDTILKQGLDNYENSLHLPPDYFKKADWPAIFAKILPVTRKPLRPNANRQTATFMVSKVWGNKAGNYAVIDIGSNNVNMLLANKQGSTIKRLLLTSKISALGQGMQDNNLQPQALSRVQDILDNLLAQADSYTDKIIVTGTSACRRAKNINQLANLLKTRWGLALHVLSGQQEAKLNLQANMAEFSDTNLVVFDIGGGSTEFGIAVNGKPTKLISIELGLRRLLDDFPTLHQRAKHIDVLLNELDLPLPDKFTTVGIGGTTATLCALHRGLARYQPRLLQKQQLPLDSVQDMFNNYSVNKIPNTFPYNIIGQEAFLTGCLVVIKIMRKLNVKHIVNSEAGLYQGLLLEPEHVLNEMAQRV